MEQKKLPLHGKNLLNFWPTRRLTVMYDFNKHFDTYQRQREDMLPIDPEYISIIACTMRPEFINNIFANYNRQSYKNKELIIILNHDDIDIDKVKIKAMLYN